MSEQLMQLYAQKGEIVTAMEVSQARLQVINQQIVEIMNKQRQEPPQSDDK